MGKESRRNRSPLDYLDSRCFDCDPTRWRQTAYKQYSQIVPNGAIYSQEMACYLRRFSPEDGRLLIGFGRGGTPTVMVYRVCYLANASNFEDIFKLAHTIRLGSLNENICKDFCLFTSNDRFVSRPFLISSSPP